MYWCPPLLLLPRISSCSKQLQRATAHQLQRSTAQTITAEHRSSITAEHRSNNYSGALLINYSGAPLKQSQRSTASFYKYFLTYSKSVTTGLLGSLLPCRNAVPGSPACAPHVEGLAALAWRRTVLGDVGLHGCMAAGALGLVQALVAAPVGAAGVAVAL